MRQMPDNAFDLAVVDPPYGIGMFSMTFTKEGGRQFGHSATPKRDYRNLSKWDVKPSKEYFDQVLDDAFTQAALKWNTRATEATKNEPILSTDSMMRKG